MLRLEKITKSYQTGTFFQEALSDVSIAFRPKEFVAVLGESGSGKTTLLNIIGGLDRYDKGNLFIDGRSTDNFKGTEWDAYRNNSIGFVFQSYNLIPHISVAGNIELSMTLSGLSRRERHKKTLDALERVGLADHARKKPGQLSGGQMQRVAIARALVNDPDIILADEPTGALDSETSIQIMDLISEIAVDKLVIMVTHNENLANRYASRIVKLKDGKVIGDSNPFTEEKDKVAGYSLKKTSMSFFTALKLSFNNILTKKGRTLLTAFASSIGIIGIALIMSFSNGLDIKISEFESGTLAEYPVMISRQSFEMSEKAMEQMRDNMQENRPGAQHDLSSEPFVFAYDRDAQRVMHTNKLSDAYVEHIEGIDPELINGIAYTRALGFNLLKKSNGLVTPVATKDIEFSSLAKSFDDDMGVTEKNYDVLAGNSPESSRDIVLIIDAKNRADVKLLSALGIDAKEDEQISFDDFIGLELSLVQNDDFYMDHGNFFTHNPDLEAAYESPDTIKLNISGILRLKSDSEIPTLSSTGLAYTEELVELVVENAKKSQIVQKQLASDFNVMTGEKFSTSEDDAGEAKSRFLSYLGADATPFVIMIYPRDFDSKTMILSHLDNFNQGLEQDDRIVYTDLAAIITNLSGSIMNAITIVLVSFSSISLVVSVFMIAIITYISVLERTKEIGILRAMGARKRDITRVFNAETFIIGLCSGFIGIVSAVLLLIPANIIVEKFSEMPDVGAMNPLHALILIIVSLSLTVLGGFIPAMFAASRDPVAALRSE